MLRRLMEAILSAGRRPAQRRTKTLVSVIVPVMFASDAVAIVSAVRAQRQIRTEVLLVADPDAALGLRHLVDNDSGVRIVDSSETGQPEGLAEAWRLARGEFIAIATSANRWKPNALSRLVAALERSQAVAATALTPRPKTGFLAVQAWERAAGLLTSADDVDLCHSPEILVESSPDVTCWRRSLVDPLAVVGSAEESVDLSRAWLRSLLAAPQVALVEGVQSRPEPVTVGEGAGLAAQLAWWRELVVTMVAGGADREYVTARVLDRGLWRHVPALGALGTEHEDAFTAAVATFADDDAVLRALDHPFKALFYAACQIEGVRTAIELRPWMEEPIQMKETRRSEDGVFLVPPRSGVLDGMDPRHLDITDRVTAQVMVTGLNWRDDRLRVRGWAYLTFSADAKDQSIRARLVSDTGDSHALEVRRRLEPWVVESSLSPWADLLESGFEFDLDPQLFHGADRWHVEISVMNESVERSAPLAAVHPWVAGAIPPWHRLDGDRGVIVNFADCVEVLLAPRPSAAGDPDAAVQVSGGTWSGSVVKLEGTGPRGIRGALRIVDAAGTLAAEVPWASDDAGVVEVTLPLTVENGDGVVRPLGAGTYRVVAGDGAMIVSDPNAWLPLERTDRGQRAVLYAGTEGRLLVDVRPPSHLDERGRRAQRILAGQHFTAPMRIEANSVFLSSFGGKQFACHPEAVGAALAGTEDCGTIHVDVVDESVVVPTWANPVVRGTRAWFEALSGAAVVVNNTLFDDPVEITSEQFYLQTWHGTPLKRIGRDIERVLMSRRYLERSDREASQMWDALISPSPFTSDIFPRAFGFAGELAEIGSPRLDALVRDPRYAVDRVRQWFGIDRGARLVLYTPTWRDGGGVSELLDVDACAAQLSEDTVLLVRAHPNVLGRGAKRNVGRGARIVDASRYPVIEELFSAADVMFTDYSSTMFDFAVTGRPQFHFVPDLERYRDETRGFYLSLDDCALGPIVETTDAAIELLADGDATWRADASRHADFLASYLPHEDGHASERAAQRIVAGAQHRGTWR